MDGMTASPAAQGGNAMNRFLARQYGSFNVFQLMRLFNRRNGGAGVRFRADLSAAFPGREFSGVTLMPGDEGQRDEVRIDTVNYCIAGTLGPLPEPYTEWLRQRQQEQRHGAADFLDIYNHRLNKLRFNLKVATLPELNIAPPQRCMHAQRLAAVMGIGSPLLASQVKLPPRAWLALAALLGDGRRSAADIERAISLAFRAQVRLKQWVGAWRPIEQDDRIRLGQKNQRLGHTSVIGQQVWDQQARVRITIANWSYARACSFLPPRRDATPARRYHYLRSLIWLLLDRQFDCEVRLVLDGHDIPPSRLSATPDRVSDWGMRLGQTAWLRPQGGGRKAVVRFFIAAFETEDAA